MKLLQIYNAASSYRESIYRLIDKEYDTDWVFGDNIGDIKLMDTSVLRGKVTLVENIYMFGGKAYWQTNVVKQIFKSYSHYIVLGDERCLSTWIFLFLSLFFPKKKIYFWSHGQYGKEGAIKKLIQKLYWSRMDGAFIYNNYSKNIMVSNGFDESKLHVIHNSLAYDEQLKLRKSGLKSNVFKNHFENDNPVLIFIGRLTVVKKLDFVINAIAQLKENGEEYNLVFIGDGTERSSLESLTKSLGLEKQIWFYGVCYDEKTNAELVYNADLCVAPGNVGLTAMHTMMFGCPVITHNDFTWQMPEFEAIQDGKTGSFFDRNNLESLVKSISKWFKNHKESRDEIRIACYNEIDTQWNPYYQMEVIKKNL